MLLPSSSNSTRFNMTYIFLELVAGSGIAPATTLLHNLLRIFLVATVDGSTAIGIGVKADEGTATPPLEDHARR